MDEELSIMKERMLSRLDTRIGELYYMWKKIGYAKEERQRRSQAVLGQIEKLLDGIALGENVICEQLEEDVARQIEVVQQMCTTLQVSNFVPSLDLSFLDMQRVLTEKYTELEMKRDERQIVAAAENPVNAEGRPAKMHQFASVEDLANDLAVPDCEKERRQLAILATFSEVRNDVARLVDELGYEFESEAERRIVSCQVDLEAFCVDLNGNSTPRNARELKMSARSQPALKCEESQFRAQSPKDNASQPFNDSQSVSNNLQMSTDRLDLECKSRKAVLNESTVREAEALRAKLVHKKAYFTSAIDETKARLLCCWQRLAIDTDCTERFLADLADEPLSQSTLNRLLQEEKRLSALKLLQSSNYVNSLLQEIRELQDACFLFADDNETTLLDESYAEHRSNEELSTFVANLEKQIDELSCYKSRYKPVFDSLSRLESSRRELNELQARMKTSEVLCNRGGLLFKLQKEQKALQKELTKLETDVQSAIAEAEKADGVRILVFGLPFRDYLDGLRCETAVAKMRNSAARRRTSMFATSSVTHNDADAVHPAAGRRSTFRK